MSVVRGSLRAVKLPRKTTPAQVARGFSNTALRVQEPTKQADGNRTTHFGFETVAESVKESKGQTLGRFSFDSR